MFIKYIVIRKINDKKLLVFIITLFIFNEK
jgi:hypothetical protein